MKFITDAGAEFDIKNLQDIEGSFLVMSTDESLSGQQFEDIVTTFRELFPIEELKYKKLVLLGAGMDLTKFTTEQVRELLFDADNNAYTGDPELIAKAFHEAYERLAPNFGYKTREASAVDWADVPEQNKLLMIAVVAELLTKGILHPVTPIL